jgi:hypothetical protein
MAQAKEPAQRADAGRARDYIAVAANGPEHNTSADSLQAFRTAWLARRIPLSPPSARAVISVYFRELAR